jgi:superfamily II helicase
MLLIPLGVSSLCFLDNWQMIGRAGRPGFDTEGYAVVMCVEEKKIFYKKVRWNDLISGDSCYEVLVLTKLIM